MRQFLSGLAIAAGVLMGGMTAAMAQNPFAPVLYLNDTSITGFEVDQRLQFMRVLGAGNIGRQEAQEALIDDRLRRYAAAQMGLTVDADTLQVGLEEFAGRGGLSAAEFAVSLEQAGIESQTYRDFVEAGILWRNVVQQRIVPMVRVSDTEIDLEMKRRLETPVVTRVLLSELIIPAPPGQEQSAMQRATSISAAAPNDAQFAEAARLYSASESAQSGGRLNWINIDTLPPALRLIILSLKPGQTSSPLNVDGAVILFRLRDTAGTLRAGARDQLLDYLTLRMVSAPEAAALAARSRGCDDLFVQAGPQIAPQVQRMTMLQNQIPTLIATQLASLDADEAAVVNYGASADLVMLCARNPALLAEADAEIATTAEPADGVEAAIPDSQALPDRRMVLDDLRNRKVGVMADAYLAELRADAVIRRP
ncbi:peptidylprolyl isomerase [Paracoccus sp. (in: a-proteobacteria)]|uniref:peptidylprolyl isomerase n=1 Tax=Paracoccus sp. TaxID=267 RepID=UPI003A865790